MIDFKKLVKAGVHFGHQVSRWMPKMNPYIWGVKNKVHLIDVSKTAYQLERSAKFLQEVAREGKQILWVGTKKPARAVVKEMALKLNMPYVNHRWIGGTLSNYAQVKKSVTRLLHFEDVINKSEKYPHYTKKELNSIKKNADRLNAIVGGIKSLAWPIGALVLVDVNKEQSALKEAVKVGVPVVALVDTNADPSLVDYVIPANDDAPKSIAVILEYLQQAAEKGAQEKVKAAQKEAMVQAAKKEEKVAEKKAETKAPVVKKAEPKKEADANVAKKETGRAVKAKSETAPKKEDDTPDTPKATVKKTMIVKETKSE